MIAVFQTHPGTASARRGHVILDGPNKVAAVMTPKTARQLAASLLEAARIAELDEQSL